MPKSKSAVQFFQSLSKDKTFIVRETNVENMLMDPILPMEGHNGHNGHTMAVIEPVDVSGQHAGQYQPMDIEQEREVRIFFLFFETRTKLTIVSLDSQMYARCF